MKKITVFVNKLAVRRGFTLMMLLALPLWFASCSKDKDGDGHPDVKPSSVAGSWKITGMKVDPAIDLGDGNKLLICLNCIVNCRVGPTCWRV